MRDNTESDCWRKIRNGREKEFMEMLFTVVKPSIHSPVGHVTARFYGILDVLDISQEYRCGDHAVGLVSDGELLPRNISNFFEFDLGYNAISIGYNGRIFQPGYALNDEATSADCDSGKLVCKDGPRLNITLSEFQSFAFAVMAENETPYKLLSHNCADVVINAANKMRLGAAEYLIQDIGMSDWGAGSYVDYKYKENSLGKCQDAVLGSLAFEITSLLPAFLLGYAVSKYVGGDNQNYNALMAGLLTIAIAGTVAGIEATYETGIDETLSSLILPICILSCFAAKGYGSIMNIDNADKEVIALDREQSEGFLSEERRELKSVRNIVSHKEVDKKGVELV